ncbi:hypothetical protein D9615_007542 [Tricholomella constricta]|uniref:AAA+ ATPase domain-containing protein n=1 Tax=Tricholomella constricta TaxID=117010 RepID=A0A8H5H7D9_9AGAR|nr:hypothetical protein D9615_007542 [Tricholomella constricta]
MFARECCVSLRARKRSKGKATSTAPPKEAKLQFDDGLGKPTSSEYTGEAAKEFLKVLAAVAEQIPVPGVGAAVKIATNLIQACDDSHATLERAEELKLRIKTLVTILVHELKGKKAEEIQEKLKQDIKSLEKDLTYIQTKLDEIASQHALLLILFRSFNEDKVRKCVGRLESALESFNLVRQINDTNLLNKLEKQIFSFHESHQKSLEQLQVTMDEVKAILQGRLSTTSPSLQPRSRGTIPANTDIFHGRDATVADLVRTLTAASEGQKRPRVCLLGPGGMGKTCTALAVMSHPDLKKQFSDRSLIWVPCVQATSIPLLLDTLYAALGTSQNTGNALADILSELNASDPLVLLLDNFETPWNVDGRRSETERILRDIERIPHVTLFLTMRSSNAPCNDIQWYSVDLRAIDEDAARRIYTDINTEGSNDPKLPNLLKVVGNMPLAVTLMATVGKVTGLGAEELVKEYKRTGTAMLGQGSDAEHSMDICISLSVDNPAMKKHPEAYELLATLAMLPVGTTYDVLAKWWARNLPNLTGALQVLREACLIERGRSYFFVLPVIQAYILDHSRFPNAVRLSMIESACKFLMHHKSVPGDVSYKENAAALTVEEDNLQAILLEVKVAETNVIEALLVLASHHAATRPRMEVIEHTLKLVRQMKSNQALLGDVLRTYAKMFLNLDRYDEALKHFGLAQEAFVAIQAKERVAECFLDFVEVHHLADPDYDRDQRLAEEAKTSFEELNHTSGVARSLYYLGIVHAQVGRYEEAADFLTRAREMLQNPSDSRYHARCTYFLSLVYFWDREYDNAQEWGKLAEQEYDRYGQYSGDVTRLVAHVEFAKGDYAGALQTLRRCLESCKSYGRPLDIAQTLEMIGRTWSRMGRQADAQSAYVEAMRYYNTTQTQLGEHGMIRCRMYSRMLEDPLLEPTGEERDALDGYYHDV